MPQTHPHPLNAATIGLVLLASIFAVLGVLLLRANAANATVGLVLLFGAVVSAIAAWLHDRWDT